MLNEIIAYYFSSKKKHHDEDEDLDEDTAAVDVNVTSYMDQVNESVPDASFGQEDDKIRDEERNGSEAT